VDPGERFVRALAAKDDAELLAVLDPSVDFMGLTPGRSWEATSARELVDDVLLGPWFEPTDRIDELVRVELEEVVDRRRVGYRLRVTNADGPHVVDQQAYYAVDGERITWLRIMCAGFRPCS
jgi:hypothetical protein